MAKKPFLDGRTRNRGLWLALAVLGVFVVGMAMLGNSFGPDDATVADPDAVPASPSADDSSAAPAPSN
tara:strand:- start:14823 stop:15026 length:204 start_codon:yes stop_codon:yes gene_type:complete